MLLWIDLETTGLSANNDYILEVAWTITDNLCVGDDRVESHVVTPTPDAINALVITPIVYEMHEDSGLISDIENGVTVSIEEIQDAILRDMDYYGNDEPWMLAGFSVHFDKGFVETHLQGLYDVISHRVFDVSTLRTFFKPFGFISESDNLAKHRAANDVMESLSVARGYINQIKEILK